MNSLNALFQTLGYTFNHPRLLKQALTHRSAEKNHNERLEFLGDALLETIISLALYEQFPDESEGQLSRLRAHCVKGDTLADLARTLKLSDYLILGSGELKSGGFRRNSILANAFEATIAAIFLDSNFETCQKIVLSLYRDRFEHLLQLDSCLKDPKTQLQEWLQSHQYPLPCYQLQHINETGKDPLFYVECILEKPKKHALGKGLSRKKAEQNAAEQLLIAMNISKIKD